MYVCRCCCSTPTYVLYVRVGVQYVCRCMYVDVAAVHLHTYCTYVCIYSTCVGVLYVCRCMYVDVAAVHLHMYCTYVCMYSTYVDVCM